MDTNVRAIQVSRDSRFVNVGHVINEELLIFQINFIMNASNWGVTVIDPDGNAITKTAKLGVALDTIVLKVDDTEIEITIFDNDKFGLFEIYYLY